MVDHLLLNVLGARGVSYDNSGGAVCVYFALSG